MRPRKNAIDEYILPEDFATLLQNVTAERLGQPQSEQLNAQKLGHPPFQF